jgi:hypothetical protein
MDKADITNRLAGRMGATLQEAEAWLEAVLDILHGAYAEAEPDGAASSAGEDAAPAVEAGIPILRSVTPTARLSIGDEITLDRFPFRVGREGRKNAPKNRRRLRERRTAASVAKTNELYVKDFGKSVNVSREHFQIEAKDDGSYELVDRGSACGTIVSDQVVGGNFIGGRCPLKFGDSIIVGTRESTIAFEFCLASA